MNAKIIALSCLLLAFALFTAKPAEIESNIAGTGIPGGIVYSDGKDAVYYDFSTKETKNLTSDLSGAAVKSPFAVSENGKFLVWLQDSKFWMRELPTGVAKTVQVDNWEFLSREKKSHIKFGNQRIRLKPNERIGVSTGKEDIVWRGNAIKNMSLSPDGARFAFDAEFQEPGWVFTGKNVYGESGTLTGTYPFYAKIIDRFNGIFYLSTVYNKKLPPVDSPVELNFSHPRYGNVIETPPVPLFTTDIKNLAVPLSAISQNYSVGIGHGTNWTEKKLQSQIYYRRMIKKSAHYLTFHKLQSWENGKKLAAFIFQIGEQWGPIELRVLDSEKQGGTADEIYQGSGSIYAPLSKIPKNLQVPREWEILVSSKTCEGLFWKPNGSLTIQSQGDLYMIDKNHIIQGMKSSSVKKTEKPDISFHPVNNVFQAKPELVAKGVNALCGSWVTDNSFLFLGKDMEVYLWNGGEKQKLLEFPISSEFYYCSKSPLENTPSNMNLPVPTDIATGTDSAKATRAYSDPFRVGSIETSWESNRSGSIRIRIKKSEQKKGLQFVLPEENDLSKIEDPSRYEYQNEYEWRDSGIVTKDGYIPKERLMSRSLVLLNLNEVIILKSGNDYAAIKPIELEPKFKSPSDLPKENVLESWKRWDWERYGPIPIFVSMTYEWKFWPAVKEYKGKKIKNRTFEEQLASKGWKFTETPLSEEFEINGIKFKWEPIDKNQPKLPKELKNDKSYISPRQFKLRIDRNQVIEENFKLALADKYQSVRDLQNPLQYNFHESKNSQNIPTTGIGWIKNSWWTLFLKTDNNVIAIKPIKEKSGSVAYAWKFWSEITPSENPDKNLNKTALNK